MTANSAREMAGPQLKTAPDEAVLSIRNLRTCFEGPGGSIVAVDDLSYDVRRGEIVAVVGESGCGKSVTALSAMRLVRPATAIRSGQVLLDGIDLLQLDEKAMRSIRGNRMAMIFQEPMTALNPVLTIGAQLQEVFVTHLGSSNAEARRRSAEMLQRVSIAEPLKRLRQYPHELSGGMRQRVVIAMAMACEPTVLFADEPTTALDVTVQAQILDLLRELAAQTETGIVLITHDLGVVAEVATRVVVMYAGGKVEEGPTREILEQPRHPYTAGLIRSKPSLDAILATETPRRLPEIPGIVPTVTSSSHGCLFAPRCALATAICEQQPPLRAVGPGHASACWHSDRVHGGLPW